MVQLTEQRRLLVREGRGRGDIFIFGSVEFEVLVEHRCGVGRDCLKKIRKIRREKGKEWNPEENQH